MYSFFAALSFLTILPVPAFALRDKTALAYSWVWFPVVGLIVGLLSGLVGWMVLVILGVDQLSAASLSVFTQVILTRGFHYDGFSDVVDAAFGGHTIERRLEIMKDSRVGTFAVLGIVFLILFQVQVAAKLTAGEVVEFWGLAGLISRWEVIYPMLSGPYAREASLGKYFSWHATGYCVTTAVVVMISLWRVGANAIPVLVVAHSAQVLFVRFAQARFGGITGDVCGALVVLVELLVLLTLRCL